MGTGSPDQRPSIGVVIAAFNAEQFLELALSSIHNQTLKPEKVVVVDDASSDSTADVARSWCDRLPLEVISNTANLGVGASRATGIARLECEYIAVLDADDMWLPEHLALTCDRLGPRTIVSPIYQVWESDRGLGRTFGSRTRRTRAERSADQLRLLIRENFVMAGSTFPRTLYEMVGGYPCTRFAEDHELWVKLVLAGARVVFLDAPTVLYRRHSESLAPVTSETEARKLASLDRIASLVPAAYAHDVDHARRVARARILLCREREERPPSRRARAALLSPALLKAPLRQKVSAAVRILLPRARYREA